MCKAKHIPIHTDGRKMLYFVLCIRASSSTAATISFHISHSSHNFVLYLSAAPYMPSSCLPKRPSPSFLETSYFLPPPCIQFLSLSFLKLRHFTTLKRGCCRTYIRIYVFYTMGIFLFHSRICFNIVMTLRNKEL